MKWRQRIPIMPRPTTHSTRRLDSISLIVVLFLHIECLRSARVNSGVGLLVDRSNKTH